MCYLPLFHVTGKFFFCQMSTFAFWNFQNSDNRSLVDVKPRIPDDSGEKSRIWKLTEINEPSQCRSLRLPDNLTAMRVHIYFIQFKFWFLVFIILCYLPLFLGLSSHSLALHVILGCLIILVNCFELHIVLQFCSKSLGFPSLSMHLKLNPCPLP